MCDASCGQAGAASLAWIGRRRVARGESRLTSPRQGDGVSLRVATPVVRVLEPTHPALPRPLATAALLRDDALDEAVLADGPGEGSSPPSNVSGERTPEPRLKPAHGRLHTGRT